DAGPEVLEGGGGGRREGPLLVARVVAAISPLFFFAGIPLALPRVDQVEGLVVGRVVPDLVEDEKLRFRSKVSRIRNAGALEILFGFLGDVARISREWLFGDQIYHLS